MKAGRQQNGAVAELGKGSVMDGTAQEKLQRWPPEAGAARPRRQRRLGSIAAWRYSSRLALAPYLSCRLAVWHFGYGLVFFLKGLWSDFYPDFASDFYPDFFLEERWW